MNRIKRWSRRYGFILMFVWAAAPTGWAQGTFELEQTQFELDMAELEEKFENGLRKLGDGYKSALTQLQKKYMANGALDQTLLIRGELSRLEVDKSAPDTTEPDIPRDVLHYMKAYEVNHQKLSDGRNMRSAMIIKAYIVKMNALKVDLTKKGDITNATVAKEEVERIKLKYASFLIPAANVDGSEAPRASNGRNKRFASGKSDELRAFKARFPYLAGSLLAYYNFDDDSESEVNDLSGNGHNGEARGAVFVGGRKGQGVELDSNTVINFGRDTAMHKIESGSFSLWINTLSSSGVILSSYAQNGGRGFRLEINKRGQAKFLLGNENPSYYIDSATGSYVKQNTRRSDKAESTQSINDGKWHHILVTRDKKKIFIYVDGEKGSSSFSERSFMDDEGDLRINGYRYTSYDDGGTDSNYGSIIGQIDDVMAFSKPLSDQEAKSIYSMQR